MKILYKTFIAFLFFIYTLNASTNLHGSGATLSAPAYYTLSYYFYKEKNIKVYYDSIGSFSGIKKLTLNSVDFASSDKPLEKKQLIENNLVEFPTISTTINIVHNIPELKNKSIKLTNDIISKIYKNKILYWDNNQIKKVNKNITLPHKKIVVISRKGNSGTTYYFTKHLNNTSKYWKDIGITKKLKLSNVVYGISNENISQKIKETPYSIGYIPTPYKIANNLSSIIIQNKKMKWLTYLDKDYPIKVLNYTVVSKETIKNNKTFIEFFNWIFKSGDKYLIDLGYTPLNNTIKKQYYNLLSQ